MMDLHYFLELFVQKKNAFENNGWLQVYQILTLCNYFKVDFCSFAVVDMISLGTFFSHDLPHMISLVYKLVPLGYASITNMPTPCVIHSCMH